MVTKPHLELMSNENTDSKINHNGMVFKSASPSWHNPCMKVLHVFAQSYEIHSFSNHGCYKNEQEAGNQCLCLKILLFLHSQPYWTTYQKLEVTKSTSGNYKYFALFSLSLTSLPVIPLTVIEVQNALQSLYLWMKNPVSFAWSFPIAVNSF